MKHVSLTEAELSSLTERLTAIQTEMTTLERKRPRLISPSERWSNQARILALSSEQRELLMRQREIKAQRIAGMNGPQFVRDRIQKPDALRWQPLSRGGRAQTVSSAASEAPSGSKATDKGSKA